MLSQQEMDEMDVLHWLRILGSILWSWEILSKFLQFLFIFGLIVPVNAYSPSSSAALLDAETFEISVWRISGFGLAGLLNGAVYCDHKYFGLNLSNMPPW